MKNARGGRWGNRIRPKISENPDESRNSRPPSDRLLRPWMIQNCIVSRSCPEGWCGRGSAAGAGLLLQVRGRRIVARVDRVLQERGLIVGPELADVGVGLEDRVDQPPVASCHLADVDVAGGVAERVEL